MPETTVAADDGEEVGGAEADRSGRRDVGGRRRRGREGERCEGSARVLAHGRYRRGEAVDGRHGIARCRGGNRRCPP